MENEHRVEPNGGARTPDRSHERGVLKCAIEALLADRESEAAYGLLVESLLEPLDRGIAQAIKKYGLDDGRWNTKFERAHEAGNEASLYSDRFLGEKIICRCDSTVEGCTHRTFLRGLANANDLRAYIFKSAEYFVHDALRKVDLPERSRNDSDEQRPGEDPREAIAGLDKADAQRRQILFDKLDPDDQLFLQVVFVHFRDLPDASISRIAAIRGVDKATVRAELAARSCVQDDALQALEAKLESKNDALWHVQRRLRRVESAIAQKDGSPSSQACTLNKARRREFDGAYKAILAARPEERCGYLRYLLGRLELRLQEVRQANAALQKQFPGGKCWREVVQIMGGDPEDDTAVNTVNVRYLRIRRQLQEQEQPGDGV